MLLNIRSRAAAVERAKREISVMKRDGARRRVDSNIVGGAAGDYTHFRLDADMNLL